MKPVRVLIVDDSRLVREVLTELLTFHPGIDVVGAAEDAYQAREIIKQLNPDLLTLDVEMPRMDGVTFLRNLMRLRPMPVLMLSSLTTAGADVTLEALEVGAVDFIAKPLHGVSDHQLERFGQQLQEKVLAAASAPVRLQRLVRQPRATRTVPDLQPMPASHLHNALIGIGASTGGTVALMELLQGLPLGLPPIVVTQHIPPTFSERLAARLDERCLLSVKQLSDGERLLSGAVYLAPGDRHFRIGRVGGHLVGRLGSDEPVNRHRPSVEVMFESMLALDPSSATLLMLTGMGEDGARTMTRLRQAGAFTIAQDEATSMIWGMPGAVVKRGGADRVLPLSAIGAAVIEHYKARARVAGGV